MLGLLIFICLFVGVLGGLWHLAAFTKRRTQDDTALALDRVMKELASWDRVKELGFDDVLEWEHAFEKATGALPEGSRVMELGKQQKTEHERQQHRILMQANMLAGAPIRVSGNSYYNIHNIPAQHGVSVNSHNGIFVGGVIENGIITGGHWVQRP